MSSVDQALLQMGHPAAPVMPLPWAQEAAAASAATPQQPQVGLQSPFWRQDCVPNAAHRVSALQHPCDTACPCCIARGPSRESAALTA